MKSKAKQNIIYNFIYHVFVIVVPLITTPYVARKLGATGVGEYGFEYSIAAYFALFIKLGLNNYGNRAIAYTRDNKDKVSKEFWNIYFFQFLCTVVVSVFYLGYCFLISGSFLVSFILILYILSTGLDIAWFYWGMEEFKVTVTRGTLIKILSTIAIFIFIKDEDDVALYTLILCIGSVGGQIFLWPRLFRYISFVKPTRAEVIKHIKPNLILFLPAIAVSFYKIMDKIMLGVISNKAEVGFYESSEKIIKVPMAVVESFGAVMQPRMSNLVANKADPRYMSEVLKKSIVVIMLSSTILGFGIMSVADEFVPAYYGAGFEQCSLLFKILLPSCMFLALTNIFKTQYLLPKKKDKEYIRALFTGAIVNVLMNILLIPLMASGGAAVGTLAAEASVCLVIALSARREMKVLDYYRLAVPFVLAGGVMFVVSYFISFPGMSFIWGLLLKIVICGSVYVVMLAALLLLSKYVLKNDFCDEVVSTFSFLWKRKKPKNK